MEPTTVVPPLLVEDKEIKFDVPNLQNKLRGGEAVLQSFFHIEDTKGNPGDEGKLLFTNLRLIWHSLKHKKFNLSIGYGRFTSTSSRQTFSRQHGTVQALYVLATASNSARFEFLFTDVSGENAKRHEGMFNNVFEVYRLYQRTYLYRDLKLRGAILQQGQLILLPQEQVYSNVHGVWNLSSDQGNLGCFVVTSVRLVWYADTNESFNISLPYLQIAHIRLRESKYGTALVIQTAETGGGYVLGFRIDPPDRLHGVHKELNSLHAIYTAQPNLGVHLEALEGQLKERRETRAREEEAASDAVHVDDFVELDERQEREVNSKLNAYLAENSMTTARATRSASGGIEPMAEPRPRTPIYCKELGLAMERLPEGYTLKDLWDVLPSRFDDDGGGDEALAAYSFKSPSANLT